MTKKATKAAGAATAPGVTLNNPPERVLLFRGTNAITKTLADLAATMYDRRLTDGLRLHDHERANYLKAVDGKAGFSRSDVEAYFSVYADTPEQMEYIAEARRVFDTLAEFDRKTRILGRGKVRGVGDAEAGAIPEIIAVTDGKITLDLAAVSDLVFTGAEELAKRMKFDDRYIIAKPDR